jgi:hypothetical protein
MPSNHFINETAYYDKNEAMRNERTYLFSGVFFYACCTTMWILSSGIITDIWIYTLNILI